MSAQQKEVDSDRVRHVWLDAAIPAFVVDSAEGLPSLAEIPAVPALVVDRRRMERGWEERLVWVEDGRLATRWVSAERSATV